MEESGVVSVASLELHLLLILAQGRGLVRLWSSLSLLPAELTGNTIPKAKGEDDRATAQMYCIPVAVPSPSLPLSLTSSLSTLLFQSRNAYLLNHIPSFVTARSHSFIR